MEGRPVLLWWLLLSSSSPSCHCAAGRAWKAAGGGGGRRLCSLPACLPALSQPQPQPGRRAPAARKFSGRARRRAGGWRHVGARSPAGLLRGRGRRRLPRRAEPRQKKRFFLLLEPAGRVRGARLGKAALFDCARRRRCILHGRASIHCLLLQLQAGRPAGLHSS